MDIDDLIKQDQQAKQWLHDIESLRSPPPPRKLTGADIGSSRENSLGIGNAMYREQQQRQQPMINGETTMSAPADSDYDFIGKVKQFQLSNSHPYANKGRVETAKKIAAQGRSAGLISGGETNDRGDKNAASNKKVISKQQVDELRDNVRRETRPLNPYPNPDKQQKLHVDTALTNNNALGDYSSSAYSSYSSGELSKSIPPPTNNGLNLTPKDDVVVDTAYRKGHSINAEEPAYRIPPVVNNTKLNTNPNTINDEDYYNVPSLPNSNANIIDTKINNEHRQTSEPAPSRNVINDRDLLAVFDDFDKDYQNLSSSSINRSISKSPNRMINDQQQQQAINDYPSPNSVNYGSSNNAKYNNYVSVNNGDYRSVGSIGGGGGGGPTVRLPPAVPPYRPPNGRLPSPGNTSMPANHYRQSSSPISAPSPPIRNGGNRYPARNLNRSQSMQENIQQQQQQQQPAAVPPINVVMNNYERMTTGRDIIVDRIPRSSTDFDGFTKNIGANSNNYASPKPVFSSGPGRYENRVMSNGQSVNNGGHHHHHHHQQQQQQQQQDPTIYGFGSTDALEEQQRKFLQLEAQVEREMQSKAVDYGVCHHCGEKVTNVNEATQALGHLYHAKCFACCSCGRALKGKKFYEVRGQVYCEEDYLFSGFQQSAERCAVCGHLIMDMILQAVGKSFHPGCFRCVSCKESLDGVPFTMDDQDRVYCINDYHRLFAPKCAKCSKPITPSVGRDETVRVVAMQKNYHVDCYICEGCGLQLTDEPEKRCYPLGEHLLCHRCHIHWSRTGGTVHPITDL